MACPGQSSALVRLSPGVSGFWLDRWGLVDPCSQGCSLLVAFPVGTAPEVPEAAGPAAAAAGRRAGEAPEAAGDRREPGSEAEESEGAQRPRGAEETEQWEAR